MFVCQCICVRFGELSSNSLQLPKKKIFIVIGSSSPSSSCRSLAKLIHELLGYLTCPYG